MRSLVWLPVEGCGGSVLWWSGSGGVVTGDLRPRPDRSNHVHDLDSWFHSTRLDSTRLDAARPAGCRPPSAGVLQAAAEGLSTRQIAARLHSSEQNVGCHLRQLMEKMHVGNRAALVARAVQHDLVVQPGPD